ncbi:MATE family efflux transporter [Thomasclavelia cocleata]|uniref:MATE family efflux transporter n=2 Tax=Bacteria TaxID=2 RepID=UPI002557D833|nr:MATE family efflux transporter [Thomasclavelia cocleata]
MGYNITSKSQMAKNSLLLYIRTFITIIISIYASRITLLKLGEDDFGIFTAVGGIAIIFGFLGSSFFSATQRYLTMAIVSNKPDEYKKVFTTTIQCYIVLSLLVLIFGETVGLYIVNYILNFSPDKTIAANIVYQFSLITLVLGLTNLPYKASIIAHEKYSYYAYIDVIIKILRLLILFLLFLAPNQKLILYSGLYTLVSLFNNIIDKIYCYFRFPECRFIKVWDKQMFLEITKFSTYSIFQKSAETVSNQGNNILINVFGGIIASASFGLANQVWGTLISFFMNVQTAFSPQITKSYGAGDLKRFNNLILNSCKISSYLVIFLSIPLIVNMPLVMSIWLTDVPQYATDFCLIVVFSAFIGALSNPLSTAIIAVGKIKRYQIITSLFYFISLPISYLLLDYGIALIAVFVVRIFCQVVAMIYSGLYLARLTPFESKHYFFDCCLSSLSLIIGIVIPRFIQLNIHINEYLIAIISSLIGEILFISIIFKFGLSTIQRTRIKLFILSKLK